MEESERVPKKGRIRASTNKVAWQVPEKESNQCEYRKIEESGRLPEKGRIRASIENLSRRVWKTCRGEYRKRIESV